MHCSLYELQCLVKNSYLHVNQGHMRGVHCLQGKACAAAVKVGILHNSTTAVVRWLFLIIRLV